MNMNKRSRTNIQVSENHSHKRIRQYGGAAAAADIVTTKTTPTTKQIFKGDAMEKLNKLLDLDLDVRNSDGNYKFKFKNTTISEIQSKLEPNITNLQNAIVRLGTKLNSDDIAGILKFNLHGNKTLLQDNLQQINLQLEYLNTKNIIEKIANEVFQGQDTTHLLTNLTNSFQQSHAFRAQVEALFNNANNIPITLIGLTHAAINTGWRKITNREAGVSSHISSSEQILASAYNIDILEEQNAAQINEYFVQCEKLQVYYNQKHNEIIELYDILRGIITIKLTLVNLILEIVLILQINITRRGTETTIITKNDDEYFEEEDINDDAPRPKLPIMIKKPILEEMEDKLKQQKTLLEAARTLFNTVSNEESQAGGAAAAAAADPSAQQKMNISDLSGQNAEFTITNLDPDPNKIKPGQNIMITIPGNQQALLARYIGFDAPNSNVFKFKLIQGNDVFSDIQRLFNNAQLEDQKIYIDFIDYVIPDVETMQVIAALKQISIVEKTLLLRQASRMIPDAELQNMKITQYANINSYPANTVEIQPESVEFTQDNTPDNTNEKRQHIERVILNCYDLQNLYLIKHLEFINLFKMILYFSDMYMVNISIFNYIILLFQTDTLPYKYINKEIRKQGRKIISRSRRESEVEPYQTTVNLPRVLIDNLPAVLEQQANAVASMIPSTSTDIQEGGAAAAANPMQQEQPNESTFQEKIRQLIEPFNITYNYANLHELENKISKRLLDDGYNENLFKAWLLVRIERLNRLLTKRETNDDLKPKINQMIEEYGSLAESDSLDISAYINKYSELISSDYVLGKIKEEIELLPEQASQQGKEIGKENQNVIAAKKDLLETLKEHGVCTLGNKASCESDYDKSFTLLKSTLIKMGFTDDDVNTIITLDDIIDKFAVNQIALYLLKNVSFEDMLEKVKAKITDSQSKTNIIDIIQRILEKKQEIDKRHAEEEEARRRAAEEARKNPTYGRLKTESTYFHLTPVIQIIKTFNNKTREQQDKIRFDINSNSKINIIFELFQNIYNQLDAKTYPENGSDNSKFLVDMAKPDSEELVHDKYINYLAFISQLVSQLSTLDNITVILADLLEIINGAARTIIRIKPIEQRNDNDVPLISEGESAKYNVLSYINSLPQQRGGYNYTDIINVDPNDKLKLRIGTYCSGEILPEKRDDYYAYGPFSAVYPPQYNNFDIYANLFGLQTIQEIRGGTQPDASNQTKIKVKLNSTLQTADRAFGAVKNPEQGLMQKLANGGSVVIFGYGFSGSGKTYALIEGSKESYEGKYKYDPSMLEQFIKSNSDVIGSVEFMELYPLGIGSTGKTKIISKGTEPIQPLKVIKGKSDNYNEYVMYANELGETGVKPTEITDLYAPITEGITFQTISRRIKLLERHRIHKLRILATPNNDNSSRSFLQITLNINNPNASDKPGKLVFFDMPGTENTVRIKAEFMGSDIFESIIGKYTRGITYHIDEFGNANENPTAKKPSDSRIILDVKGNVIEKQENNSQLHKIHDAKKLNLNYCQPPGLLKIFAIQKNISTQQQPQPDDDDKKNEDMVFKYNLMTQTKFSSFGINVKDKIIGEVGREMALFFNGLDCNSVYETNKPIIFFSNQDHRDIFSTFMKFFNKKDGKTPIFYSVNNTGKCKISAELNETDKTNLFKIFKLKEESTITTSDDYFGITDGSFNKLNPKDGYYSLDYIMEFKTKQPEAQPLRQIYFYNPLIKYLYLLINFAYCTKFSKQTNISGLDKTEFYIVCNFFIYKFIKFIVEQGRNIITTLEHLKFFFLSRVDGIQGYNQDALSKEASQTKGNGNKAFLFDSMEAALHKDKTYIIPMKYGTKVKPITIEEKVNLGQFEKFKLLSMLQDLAGNQSNLSSLRTVPVSTDKGERFYPDLMTPLRSDAGAAAAAPAQNKFGAIFVMFANIKAYIRDPTTYNLTNVDDPLQKELPKLCTAEFDTLEFAESISSTTYNKNLGMTGVGGAAAKHGGGGNKQNLLYRNNKDIRYYLSTRHKSTLKKSFASRQHSVYSRKSKKFSRL